MKIVNNSRQRGEDIYKKLLLGLVGVTAIIAVLILTLSQVRSVRSGAQATTPTPTYALTPVDTVLLPIMPTAIQPEILDLAPDVPHENKPGIVVQHSNGRRTMYLIAPDAYEAFIENLPEGDRVVADIPSPSLMYGEPPTTTPEP